MMRQIAIILLLSGLLLPSAPMLGQSVDLRVPFDRLMDEGFEAYNNGEYERAATAFRDARLIRPDSAEAQLNLGLSEAKRGNLEAARELFRRSRQHLAPEDSRRSDALYNEGTTWLQEGLAALENEETIPEAPEKLIEAINVFGEVLRANPQHEPARHNRATAQSLLAQMEPPPPPPPQSGGDNEENDEGEEEDSSDQSEGGQDQQSQDEQQDGESDQQQEGEQDQQQEGDSQQQEQQEQQQSQQQDQQPPSDSQSPPDEQNPSETDQREGQASTSLTEERPEEMTPEEARQLLNLLGNRDLLIFRQSRQPMQPPGGRDW